MDDRETDKQRNPIVGAFLGSLQLALVVGVLVAALALNRILVLAGGQNAPEPAPVRPALVSVITPEPQTETLVITETGTVEPRTELSITPQVGGRVISVSANFGAGRAFGPGEVLFAIDQEDYRLRLRQAEADLRTAESSLALEQAEAVSATREWTLINPEEPAPPLVARVPQLAQARASVDVAAAAVDDARLALKRTEFSFPFAGRVLTTTVEQGLTVAANQSYGTVYSEDGVEVVIALAPSDLEALEPAEGRSAVVTGRVGARGMSVAATVTRVEGALDPRSRLVGLVLGFEDQAPFLPRSFVSAEISGPQLENIFVLPPSAVSAAGRVWIVVDERLSRRQIDIIARTDTKVLAQIFEVADGVVTTPPAGAREGQAVRIADDDRGPVTTALAAE